MKVYKCILFLVTVLLCLGNLGAQTWLDQVVPGETRLDEIQGIIGVAPTILRVDDAKLSFKDGNVFLGISPGRCVKSTWGIWDIEPGTIVSIIYYPKKKISPKKLNLPSAGMEEGFDSGHKTFLNQRLGLAYSTQFGKVMSIRKFPAARFLPLKCRSESIASP